MTLKQKRFSAAEMKSMIVQVSRTNFLLAKQLKNILAIRLKTRPDEKMVPRKLTWLYSFMFSATSDLVARGA